MEDEFDTDNEDGEYEEIPKLGLRPGVKNLMFFGNKHTRKKYTTNYASFMTYIKEENAGTVNEHGVCNFFHDMLERESFGIGSVWSMYSAINANTKVHLNINLNSYKLLRQLLKNITKHYLPKKAGLLTFGQIKELLTEGLDHPNPKELQAIIFISLQYFGLLKGCEVRCVEIGDVSMAEDGSISVDFPHATKS